MSHQDTSESAAICHMLEPVDLNVKVKRNLASSWYHKLPIADVDGSLPAVKVFGLIVFLSMQNI